MKIHLSRQIFLKHLRKIKQFVLTIKTRFEAQKLTLVVEMSKVEIWIKEIKVYQCFLYLLSKGGNEIAKSPKVIIAFLTSKQCFKIGKEKKKIGEREVID